MRIGTCSIIICLAFASCATTGSTRAQNTFALVTAGQPKAVIVAPNEIDKSEQAGINDLVEFVEKMSGAKLQVLKADDPVPEGMKAIRVGQALAAPVQKVLDKVADSPGGYVIAVDQGTLYLAGQTPLATSFACTELLERLGCRWYIPGELGEVYPKTKDLRFTGPDVVDKPDFNPRWLRLDRDWSRRNKLGGGGVPAAHSFARVVPREEFEKHPEWFPLRNGVRMGRGQLCLSNPEVVQRFIEHAKATFRKKPDARGISLGPNDGRGWCECKPCEAMDSGRVDPFAADRDVVDRQIKLMNAVAEEVDKEFPGKKYGFYVYSNYQMPPLTVKPHPGIVPVFAPITYCRLHSMFNPNCPDRRAVRKMYEGWSEHNLEMHYRGYTFNLAGLQGPFQCFYKWMDDMPWMYEHNMRGFFPESAQSWASSAPQYYLATKLSWRVKQDARAIVKEFCDGLFGPAGTDMNRYFWGLADALRQANYHTGNDTNYPQVYTPQVMAAGQKDLTAAAKASKTDREQQCIKIFQMGHDYLQAFLDMQRRQNAFEFAKSKAAHDRLVKVRDELLNWDKRFLSGRAATSYLRRFWGPAVVQSHEKTSDGNELVAKFPDEWQFILDPNDAGEWFEWFLPEVTGGNWSTIKTFSASWCDQGLNYYKGVAWYKTAVDVPARFKGRKIMMWFGAFDEAVQVWVNGKPISYEYVKKERKTGKVLLREKRNTLSGSWRPLELEVTGAIEFGKANTFVVKAINKTLNELGTGGIQKVVMLHAPKP